MQCNPPLFLSLSLWIWLYILSYIILLQYLWYVYVSYCIIILLQYTDTLAIMSLLNQTRAGSNPNFSWTCFVWTLIFLSGPGYPGSLWLIETSLKTNYNYSKKKKKKKNQLQVVSPRILSIYRKLAMLCIRLFPHSGLVEYPTCDLPIPIWIGLEINGVQIPSYGPPCWMYWQ